MRSFENLKEIWKIWKKLGKKEWQPCINHKNKIYKKNNVDVILNKIKMLKENTVIFLKVYLDKVKIWKYC